MGIYVCLEYVGLDLNKFLDEIWWGTDDAKNEGDPILCTQILLAIGHNIVDGVG
jgi:hypothetical protein